MSKEMDFFIFLLEHYAKHKQTTADVVMKQWDELDLTDFIYDMYELYHIERLENAFDDIDRLIAERAYEKAVSEYRKNTVTLSHEEVAGLLELD